MKKIFALLLLFTAVLHGNSYSQTINLPPASEKVLIDTVKDEKGLNLKSLDDVLLTVKAESVSNVTVTELCNGAIGGVREYLKSKKMDVSSIKMIEAAATDELTLERFNSVYNALLTKYVKADKEQISYAAARGALKKLNDPYALFMDPKEYKKLMDQMKGGNFGGVGIYLEIDNKEKVIKVLGVMEDTPAESAGLKKGDVIIGIDGKPLKDFVPFDKAHEKLRGEPGSKVVVKIKRSNLEPFDVEMAREIIKAKTLTYKMIDDGIGYIRLNIFGEGTNDEIRKALDELERSGAIGYIFDIRGNTGGYVNAAVHVVSEFVATGTNVVTVVRQGQKNLPYLSLPSARVAAPPLAILIDKDSASSSEITAGALQDYKIATVVGTTSYGKAKIQKIYPLQGGTAMKFTTSYYLTPMGRAIDKKGIKPDIVLKQPDNKPALNEKDDVILARAKSLIAERVMAIKANASGESTSQAIQTRSNEDMLRQIANMCGQGFVIKNSFLVFENGNLYDKVTVGTEYGDRVLYFNRGKYFR